MLKVSAKRQETPDTVTFLLEPLTGQIPTFSPGQFLTLLIDHYGREVRRSYSISSYPGEPYLSITVKRKPNGEISRHLIEQVPVGALLCSLPPSGRFTLAAVALAPRDIGFISAGSGIAPILPLLRQALETEPQSHVWLINQNHSEEHIIFSQQLLALASRYRDRFTLVNFLSAPVSHQVLPRRLNNGNLEQLVNSLTRYRLSETLLFTCGPEALMRMARFTLRLMGVGENQFRQEHFIIDPPPHAPFMTDTTVRNVVLRSADGTFNISVAYPTNILQADLDNQIPLPYSCRGGRCSTCAVRCISGKVVMSVNDVLTDEDLKEGWVLTCTGYAVTDLELEIR